MALGKDKNAVPINANIPDAIAIEFEVAMARRRMKKQEALAEAMLQWATGPYQPAPIHEEEQSAGIVNSAQESAERPWVDKLLAILRAGDKEAEQAIKSNLVVFARVIKESRAGDSVPSEQGAGFREALQEFDSDAARAGGVNEKAAKLLEKGGGNVRRTKQGNR